MRPIKKHNIRINGEVKEINCQLSTGIFDKNGKEIFEGDKVVFGEYDTEGVIVFDDAMFKIVHGDKFCVLGNSHAFIDIAVVEHIEEATIL